ncbi:MAG: hypothetical protein KDB27_05890 [Planctomycetales bacterium]|nr:hypothetical protein [Planctomycetales bacterium]
MSGEEKENGGDRALLGQLISSLKQQRDELALKIHLGKEDAKDEWEKVQQKLDKLADDFEPVRDAVEESASGLFASLKLVAGEVKDGFDRIKDAIIDGDVDDAKS